MFDGVKSFSQMYPVNGGRIALNEERSVLHEVHVAVEGLAGPEHTQE